MKITRLPTLLALALMLAGCGLPVRVTRIAEPQSTAPKGVRYVVKKPRFVAQLWAPGSASDVSKPEFELRLTQRMVAGDVYEVEARGGWFSNTEVSLKLASGGELESFSGGHEDKAADFIVAVVGLAAAGAGASLQAVTPRERELAEYVKGQRILYQAEQVIQKTLRARRANLKVANDNRVTLEKIEKLEKELVRVKSLRKDTVFPMKGHECHITVRGKSVVSSAQHSAEHWLTIELAK